MPAESLASEAVIPSLYLKGISTGNFSNTIEALS
jgi:hypothetical protein